MKELSKERIRGRAVVDGDGHQDIVNAGWSFSDAGLQKFAAAIIKEDRALNAPADRTYEQENAIKEGHRNKIEDDYFAARPDFNQVHRVSFRGGFDRGWDAAKKDAPADRDVMRQTVTDGMIAAYLTASNRYWRETSKWRDGTVSEATRVGLEAALAVAPADRDAAKKDAPVARDVMPVSMRPVTQKEDAVLRRAALRGAKVVHGGAQTETTPPAEQQGKQEPVGWRTPFKECEDSTIEYAFDCISDGLAYHRERLDSCDLHWIGASEPLHTRPAPDVLAELRTEVEGMPGWINPILHPPLVCIPREQVLDLIDKMGGKV